jgi:signal transduction histidine kinase
VTDQGPGIPEEIRDRVFEPFVTTKPAGSGSGLGLDNARRIVERRHRGSLSFTTGPDGTTFTVRLPLTTQGDGR